MRRRPAGSCASSRAALPHSGAWGHPRPCCSTSLQAAVSAPPPSQQIHFCHAWGSATTFFQSIIHAWRSNHCQTCRRCFQGGTWQTRNKQANHMTSGRVQNYERVPVKITNSPVSISLGILLTLCHLEKRRCPLLIPVLLVVLVLVAAAS